MSNRIRFTMTLVLSAVLIGLALSAGSTAFAGDDTQATEAAATQDVLHMSDGRVLRGKILSETATSLVFEYHNPQLNVKTKLTYDKEKVLKIERNVPAEAAPKAGAKPMTIAPKKDSKEPEKTFGAARITGETKDVPTIYIVPIRGQMGTDVVSDVYKDIKADIDLHKPQIIVFKMDCKDTQDVLYNTMGKEEAGLADMDDFRALVNLFRDELPNTRQVMWVQDSQGISSVVALAWPDLYMMPNARLGGLVAAREQTGFDQWQDEDVRGKMTAAFMAWINGFLSEYGRHSAVLADAMVQPKFSLSATWKGREVTWALDDSGEYIVDSSDKRTTEFRAKDAEDLCISKGTAESLDDLALLLGFREYQLQEGQADKILQDYQDDWRRLYDQSFGQIRDYQQFMSWATGEDAVKYLGKAKASIERVLASMERYKAVEIRLMRETGTTKLDLITIIEQIKEHLRRLKDTQPAGGGGAPTGGRSGRGG